MVLVWAPQAPHLPAAAQVGVAWAVCQGDESAGRPEMVPGVVLLVAWVPGLSAWRFNNSTERHCNAEIGRVVTLNLGVGRVPIGGLLIGVARAQQKVLFQVPADELERDRRAGPCKA